MSDLILYIDETSKSLVQSDRNATAAILPPIAQGDTLKDVTLYFLRQTGNTSIPFAYVDHSADDVLFGIGKIDTLSTGGSFRMSDGTNFTAAINFNAAAATFQSALNALTLVAADGLYSVTKTKAGFFQATANDLGARISLAADPTELIPLSYVDIVPLQIGDADNRQVWLIKPIQRRAAGQDTWINTTPGTVTVASIQTGATGFNAIQTITLPTSAFSGSISVSVTTGSGPTVTKTTPLIGIFDSSNKMQTALQTLSNVGAGNVLVTKSADGLQFIFEFTGDLAETPIANLAVNQTKVLHRIGKTASVIINRAVLESIFDGSAESIEKLEIKTVSDGTPQTRIHSQVTLFNTLLSDNSPDESGADGVYPPVGDIVTFRTGRILNAAGMFRQVVVNDDGTISHTPLVDAGWLIPSPDGTLWRVLPLDDGTFEATATVLTSGASLLPDFATTGGNRRIAIANDGTLSTTLI